MTTLRASEDIFLRLRLSKLERWVKPATRLMHSTNIKYLDPTKRTKFQTYVSRHQHVIETPLLIKHPTESPFLSGSWKIRKGSLEFYNVLLVRS